MLEHSTNIFAYEKVYRNEEDGKYSPLEKQVSVKATEFIEEMFVEEQQAMSGQGQDPLIGLKEQELQLRAQQLQQNKDLSEKKLDLDAEKLNFEGEKLRQKDNIDKERIQSQEDIADLRAEVSLAGQRR